MLFIKKISELIGHSGAVYALEQAINPESFYSGSSDTVAAKWNLSELSPEKFAVKFTSIVYSLCLLPEKNILLAGTSEGKIHFIDLANKKEIKVLLNHSQPVFDIQYAGDLILSAGGDGILSIISAESLSTIKIIKLCNNKLRAIDIYKNTALVACGDGIIRIIDLELMKMTNEFSAHKDSVYSVKFSPDGKYLLSGGKDAYLKKWLMDDVLGLMENTKSTPVLHQSSTPPERQFGRAGINPQPFSSIPAHNFSIYSIVFSPDNKLFATASRDKTIKIWDADTLELLIRINKENFDGHINSVNKLLWSNFNNYLISTGDDRKIMVWEVK